MPIRAALVLMLALGLPSWPAAAKTEAQATADAIRDVGSPVERMRIEATRTLRKALPGSRAAVIRALSGARGEAAMRLAEVLIADATPTAGAALREAVAGKDDALSLRIQLAILKDREASRAVEALPPRVAADGPPASADETRRLRDFDRLLERARLEALFLSRKSKRGGTGSYAGQYERLRPWRIPTLDLCLDVLYDRPATLPGIPPLGTFGFLHEPNVRWDIDEIQGMASHCFAELASPEDHEHVRDLLVVLKRAESDATDRWREIQIRWGPTPWREVLAFEDAVSFHMDLMVAYYRVRPGEAGERMLEAMLSRLRRVYGWSGRGSDQRRIAHALLRVGRYEEAIEVFDDSLRWGSARAMTYYNQACAYAQWGEQVEGHAREERQTMALTMLEFAAEAQWSDTDWLDEDRDLDPIRNTPRFRALRARMVKANALPDEGPESDADSRR